LVIAASETTIQKLVAPVKRRLDQPLVPLRAARTAIVEESPVTGHEWMDYWCEKLSADAVRVPSGMTDEQAAFEEPARVRKLGVRSLQ
jgi:hypothetical protein